MASVPIVLFTACDPDWKFLFAQEETPEQPIHFMHTVHVGMDSIPCAYCHFSSNVSEEAGIPPVGTCRDATGSCGARPTNSRPRS